jgi:hypothetical protein
VTLKFTERGLDSGAVPDGSTIDTLCHLVVEGLTLRDVWNQFVDTRKGGDWIVCLCWGRNRIDKRTRQDGVTGI